MPEHESSSGSPRELDAARFCLEEVRRCVECLTCSAPPAAPDNTTTSSSAAVEELFECLLQCVLQCVGVPGGDASEALCLTAQCIGALHAADRDTTESCIVSTTLQAVQATQPPASARAQHSLHAGMLRCLTEVYTRLPDDLRVGVLLPYLRDTAMAVEAAGGCAALHSPQQRGAALRLLLGVFGGDATLIMGVLADEQHGVLFDGAGSLRHAALLAVPGALPLLDPPQRARLLRAVRELCMLDPTAQTRRAACNVYFPSVPCEAELLAHRLLDKDRQVRVAALRHLTSLPATQLQQCYLGGGGGLAAATAHALQAADPSEQRLAEAAVTQLLSGAQDLPGMLAHLDLRCNHRALEPLLVREMEAADVG